jgi:hypothetical protein
MVASADPNFPRFWFLTIDADVQETVGSVTDIANLIQDVLSHPKGWASRGYRFEQVSAEEGLITRFISSFKKYVSHIRMSSSETIKNTCKFHDEELSCADLSNNVIFINSNRWNHGSVESGLSLEAYRVYLVNHEFGHLLNRGHSGCSSNYRDLCPVMYQQTISNRCCKPNSWPLSWE